MAGLAVVRGLPGARSLPKAARWKAPRAKEEDPPQFIAAQGRLQFIDAIRLQACLHACKASQRDIKRLLQWALRPASGTKFKEEYAGA